MSDNNVRKRIQEHKREMRFKPFLSKGVDIYTCILPDSADIALIERSLINKHKPVLNGTCKELDLPAADEPTWNAYNEHAHGPKQFSFWVDRDIAERMYRNLKYGDSAADFVNTALKEYLDNHNFN